ncbi:MAG: repeat domain protein, partial [Myxococcaceae bacterium]|nr:repeat domain protein [Myxococcaceae bacterium]
TVGTCNSDALGYTDAPCAAAQSCAAGRCQARICTPGAVECTGLTTRRTCNADGLAYTNTACSAAESCSGGACLPRVCTPGAVDCPDLSTRRACNTDGLGYTATACSASQSCSAGSCMTRVCTPGSAACTSLSARQACNVDGLGYTSTTCAPSESCSGGACVPRVCSPGAADCVDLSTRRVCNVDGLGYSPVTCSASQSCVGGTCTTRICTPGSATCTNASTRRVCNIDGLAYTSTTCASTETCSGSACMTRICTPGAVDCSDLSTRRVCNADGLGYASTTCSASQSCSGGTCMTRVCTPGAVSCANLSTRRVCNADGLAYTSAACGAAESCVTGACIARVCTPSAVTCAPLGPPARDVCSSTGTTNARTYCTTVDLGADPTCTGSGTCGFTCQSGSGDCNGTAADGCEIDLLRDVRHCGACNRACATGVPCVGGVCTPGTACSSCSAECNTCRRGVGVCARRGSYYCGTGSRAIDVAVAANGAFIALLDDNRLQYWGRWISPMTPYITSGVSSNDRGLYVGRPRTANVLPGATRLVMGAGAACYERAAGPPVCWYYINGAPPFTDLDTPFRGLYGLNEGPRCVSRPDGRLYCAGRATWMTLLGAPSQDLGPLTLLDSPSPSMVFDVVDASAIYGAGCAVRADGRVACWGNDSYGQLGDASTSSTIRFALVAGLTDAVQVVVGDYHVCALRRGGTVTCWGENSNGQLGTVGLATQQVPVDIASLTDVVSLATAGGSTCARKRDGSVWCWGSNGTNQLGREPTMPYSSATPLLITGVPAATHLVGNGGTYCMLSDAGTVWCWGNTFQSQTGRVALEIGLNPGLVPSLNSGVECNAPLVTPTSAEICNGLDDDCDGAVDNGCR